MEGRRLDPLGGQAGCREPALDPRLQLGGGVLVEGEEHDLLGPRQLAGDGIRGPGHHDRRLARSRSSDDIDPVVVGHDRAGLLVSQRAARDRVEERPTRLDDRRGDLVVDRLHPPTRAFLRQPEGPGSRRMAGNGWLFVGDAWTGREQCGDVLLGDPPEVSLSRLDRGRELLGPGGEGSGQCILHGLLEASALVPGQAAQDTDPLRHPGHGHGGPPPSAGHRDAVGAGEGDVEFVGVKAKSESVVASDEDPVLAVRRGPAPYDGNRQRSPLLVRAPRGPPAGYSHNA